MYGSYMNKFKLISQFKPSGDQPQAIESLCKGILEGKRDQALLGVTGSGKTFTMANIIQRMQKPSMILAPNKTLAAQLYEEMKSFFPYNAVEYFVSFYDYYQPEAYVPQTDTFIEKDSAINEYIDRLRHSATRSMLTRRDTIVIASVSCIYGIGSPESYGSMVLNLKTGMEISQDEVLRKLIEIQYERKEHSFERGNIQVKGDCISVFPSHYENSAWRISFFDNTIDNITEFLPITGEKIQNIDQISIFANSHYVTPRPTITQAIVSIKEELQERIKAFESQQKYLEAQRIRERTNYDMEMLSATNYCKGIEHYSRYLSGQEAGEAPPTLFSYLPEDAILFVDESHVAVPQINSMYNGDKARKQTLIEYGFRLPSAADNRPLKFSEWEESKPVTIYISATPGKYEMAKTNNQYVEQIIRPTGLIDPVCIVKPAHQQVDDLIGEIRKVTAKGYRTLVTTLTKKTAEHLVEYFQEIGIKSAYLHSNVHTLDRIDVINDVRLGINDVLIGVNLLREGLDIPECGLMAILDADKEGFLRSTTSLIQTIGRAARNADSKVILYADKMTQSMERALQETERRRKIQMAYNQKHNITPKTIEKSINSTLQTEKNKQRSLKNEEEKTNAIYSKNNITKLEKQMLTAANNLDFETAAAIRDQISELRKEQKQT